MSNVTVAENKLCDNKDHKIAYIGSFAEHEGTKVDTFYCSTCNCTWGEL